MKNKRTAKTKPTPAPQAAPAPRWPTGPGPVNYRRRARTGPVLLERRRELVEKAKAIAAKLGTERLTLSQFKQHTGISAMSVHRLFDGWRELCREAGLAPPIENMRVGDDELFGAMRDAFLKLGGIAPQLRFERQFKYSIGILYGRNWNWPDALAAFRRWAEKHAPDFPYLAALPKQAPARAAPPPPAAPPAPAAEPKGAAPAPSAARAAAPRPLGDPVNYGGIAHAPVNEQGVVFAFGVVAERLGFAVEAVTTGFPDCEAKRRVGQGRWARVRIEFEFQSRAFRDHGHDRKGCDLIVCWEHNWPQCPLEVIELRRAIPELRMRSGGAPPVSP